MSEHPFTALVLALALSITALAPARAETAMSAPRRIASINLCTGALALALVPRARVVSVTQFAADPHMSPVAARARGIPVNYSRAARVLLSRPDLVLAGRFNSPDTLALLRRLHLPLAVVGVPRTLAGTRALIRRFGRLLGARERAARMVRRLGAALRRARAADAGGRPPVAVVFMANGYTAGRGTLIDALLRRAGFANLAAREGIRGFARLGLERLVLGHPDLLVVSAADDAPDLAHRILRDPALRDLERSVRVVRIPPRLWTCPGPWLTEALARLRAAREGLAAQARRR